MSLNFEFYVTVGCCAITPAIPRRLRSGRRFILTWGFLSTLAAEHFLYFGGPDSRYLGDIFVILYYLIAIAAYFYDGIFPAGVQPFLLWSLCPVAAFGGVVGGALLPEHSSWIGALAGAGSFWLLGAQFVYFLGSSGVGMLAPHYLAGSTLILLTCYGSTYSFAVVTYSVLVVVGIIQLVIKIDDRNWYE